MQISLGDIGGTHIEEIAIAMVQSIVPSTIISVLMVCILFIKVNKQDEERISALYRKLFTAGAMGLPLYTLILFCKILAVKNPSLLTHFESIAFCGYCVFFGLICVLKCKLDFRFIDEEEVEYRKVKGIYN